MKSVRLIFIFVWICIAHSVIPVNAQSAADTVHIIDDIVESWKNNGPGGVMLISRGNKEIYKKAFGYANLELGIKNTPETVFEAGSVSKQFTATAILLLAEDKKLSLDDDIRKYLTDFPDYHEKITIKNLITHTSGIKDWRNIIALGAWPTGSKVYAQPEIMEIICKQKSLNFEPGTEYSYSNSNYNVLVSLIEKITGKSFASYTREKIFVPVGMENTRWRDNFREIVKNRATAYSKSKNGYLSDMPFENGHGPGGLLTTVGDLQKWNQYWAAGKFGKTLDSLHTAQFVLSNGIKIPYTSGAVFVKYVNGYKTISHGGATAGYRSLLSYYPDLGISVVLLCNHSSINTSSVSKNLDMLFTGKNSTLFLTGGQGKNIDAQSYNKYTGVYKRPDRFEIKNITIKNNALMDGNTKILGLQKDTLISGSEKIIFKNNSLVSYASSGTYLYEKTLPFTPSENEQQKYTGKFYSEEADAYIEISLNNGTLKVIRENHAPVIMKPVYPDAFQAGGLLLHFTRDAENNISRVSVSLSRAENIIFDKNH